MYFGLPMLLNHAQPRSFLVTGPPAATAADVTVFVAAAAAATEGALMVAIRAGAMFSQASDGQRVNSGSCRRRAQIIASLQINKTAKSMRTFPDRQDTSAVPIVSRRAPPRQGLLTVVEEPPRVCCVRHGKQGVAVPPCRLGGNAPAEQRWPGGRCTLQKCFGAGPASVAVAPAPGTMMANSPEKLSLAVLQEPPTVFYNQQGGKYESFEVHVVSAREHASAVLPSLPPLLSPRRVQWVTIFIPLACVQSLRGSCRHEAMHVRESLPLEVRLLYENQKVVDAQHILQLMDRPTLDLKTRNAVIKARINEVSKNHQSQQFRLRVSVGQLKLGPGVAPFPPVRDVLTTAIKVLSKRGNRRRAKSSRRGSSASPTGSPRAVVAPRPAPAAAAVASPAVGSGGGAATAREATACSRSRKRQRVSTVVDSTQGAVGWVNSVRARELRRGPWCVACFRRDVP